MAELRVICGRGDREAGPRAPARGVHAADAPGGAEGAATQRVAVVCGAWHAPALTGPLRAGGRRRRGPAGDAQAQGDADLGAVDAPAARHRSGYGAGITSPGWYHHLFTAPDRPIARWLTDGRPLPARPRPAGVQRPRDRGGPAGRDARRPARPAAGRAGRGHRRDPGGAVRGRRARACASSPTTSSSARRSARVARRGADRAAGGGPGRTLPDAAAQAGGDGARAHDLDLRRADRPAAVRAVPPAPAARDRLGHAGRQRACRAGAPSGRPGSRAGGPSYAVAVVEAAVWGTTVAVRRDRAGATAIGRDGVAGGAHPGGRALPARRPAGGARPAACRPRPTGRRSTPTSCT